MQWSWDRLLQRQVCAVSLTEGLGGGVSEMLHPLGRTAGPEELVQGRGRQATKLGKRRRSGWVCCTQPVLSNLSLSRDAATTSLGASISDRCSGAPRAGDQARGSGVRQEGRRSLSWRDGNSYALQLP